MTDLYFKILFYVDAFLFFAAFVLVMIYWPKIYKYFKGD